MVVHDSTIRFGRQLPGLRLQKPQSGRNIYTNVPQIAAIHEGIEASICLAAKRLLQTRVLLDFDHQVLSLTGIALRRSSPAFPTLSPYPRPALRGPGLSSSNMTSPTGSAMLR
jgi:hypothetical protein